MSGLTRRRASHRSSPSARGLLNVLLLVAIGAYGGPAAAGGNEPPTGDCGALLNLEVRDLQITLAEPVAANSFRPREDAEPMATPPFCRVAATAPAAVRIEIWLPEEWNGRFLGVGNGGMAGTISYAALARGVTNGYATVSTDTGHEAGDVPFNASWAAGRPDLIEDFGHRALHLATVHGKTFTKTYYGSAESYAYYAGCSKGGQQGLMEAQRYPGDYDGLLVGNPANDWTRFYAGAHLWYSLATLAEPGAYLPASKLPALGAAVNAACDEIDGIADGVLLDPRQCEFDPAVLTCPDWVDNETCLTREQVDAVRKIYSGVRNSRGELVFPGLVPGGEAAPGGWSRWVTGSRPFTSLHWLGGEGFFRWFVFEDPDWDFKTFDFDADLDFALEKVGDAVDADDPDLRPLRDRGGKLLVYHGWSDPDISPLGSIKYYEDVLETLADGRDREEVLDETREFFRLFMVPGLGHCRGGPGVDQFDGLNALVAWVEEGTAPETIIASRVEDNVTTRTLPLCPYPANPAWNGEGDPYKAESFVCRAD
jgi:feruloyl esterase